MPPGSDHPFPTLQTTYQLPDPPPQFASAGQDDAFKSADYTISESRHPRVEAIMQASQPAVHQSPNIPPRPMSPFSEYSFPYHNGSSDGVGAFDGLGDSKVDSPSSTKASDNPGFLSGAQDQNTMSAGQFTYHAGSISVDGSDGLSPTSSRDPGKALDDKTINTGGENDAIDGGKDSKKRIAESEKPAWSELKTKAGKERKRLPLACIACRRKKIRCSGEKPACKHCLRSRIPCVYKVTTRKAAPRTDYMAMLDKRLKRMEDRVIKLVPKEEQNVVSSIGRSIVKPSLPGQGKPGKGSNLKKRSADEAFSSDLKDWSKSGSSTAMAPGSSKPNPLVTSDSEAHRLEMEEGAEHLPSQDLQVHLSEVYFDCLYGQSYHLLHKPSYMRRLRAKTLPPVLVLAVCALSARFSTHPQVATEPAFLRGEKWAAPAREIALKRYDQPNITILSVLLMLGLHEFGTCQGGRSWMLGGMAMRMAYALQLHQELDHDPIGRKGDKQMPLSFTDREIRRRTMWACFMMDRFNSSGTDRPICANEEEIKIQLPIKESHFQMEIPGPTESLDGSIPNPMSPSNGHVSNAKENMGVAAYTVRAIALWGRVIKYLNLGGKQSDRYVCHHPESGFSSLKKQILEFKSSLPNYLEYSPDNLRNYAVEGLANQYLFLHICCQQIILFMHRYAIPMAPGLQPPAGIPKNILANSARLAIEAANQISELVAQALEYSVDAPFAGYSAFLSSTVHVWGIFSHNTQLEATAKKCLAQNVRYLSKMKKHWGMFHYMAESLKGIYRRFADASMKGTVTPGGINQPSSVFQYGDWFDQYPHGVSEIDYEDPASHSDKEPGKEAVMSQKSDLQSVEDFFRSLSPPSKSDQNLRKTTKRVAKRRISTTQTQSATKLETTKQQPPSVLPQQHPPRPQPQPFPSSLPPSDPSSLLTAYQTPSLSNSLFQQNSQIQAQNPQPLFNPPPTSTFPDFYPPGQPSTIPQLDRHLVYGGFSGMESAAPLNSHQHLNAAFFVGDLNLDGTTTDNSNSGDGGNSGLAAASAFWNEPSSAYFTPFNMDPPPLSAVDGRNEDLWGGLGLGGLGSGFNLGNFGMLGSNAEVGAGSIIGGTDVGVGIGVGSFKQQGNGQRDGGGGGG
ncbi:MAG: hypothetical protein M1834_000822 [Cirrosporium novae-zelandiae]|nr:MAG: hypothetical protein M1834_000822 [Cirrosporium novae-zelandiae]